VQTGLTGLVGLGLGAATPAAGAGDDQPPNTLKVVLASRERARFRIEVSGRIEFGNNAGEDENDTRLAKDAVEGQLVGTPGKAFDEFRYSGRVTGFEILAGDVAVFVNGRRVAVRKDTRLRNRIIVVTLTEESAYRIQASDRIEFGRGAGENDELVDDDTVAGRIVGRPGRAFDAYRFAGDTIEIEVSEGAVAFGVSRARRPYSEDEDTLPNSVTITATGDPVEYRFRVSGSVRKGPLAEGDDGGATSDVVTDGTSVEGGAQADPDTGDPQSDDYRYSGNIIFERAESPVEITLEPNPDS
jgi:hypothetical protein